LSVFNELVVEAVVEIRVGDHCGYSDAEACGGGDEGLANITR
jgi:hypothetical protein